MSRIVEYPNDRILDFVSFDIYKHFLERAIIEGLFLSSSEYVRNTPDFEF